MIAARVAGVPMPESFIASRSSSSSTSLPAVSIAPSSEASRVAPRRLGLLLGGRDLARVDVLALLELRAAAGRGPRRRRRRRLALAAARRRRRASPARAGPCRACGRRARRPWSPRACSRTPPRGGRRRGSGARPCRRSRRSSSLILSSLCSELVGMIAWWSVTFASLTTRAERQQVERRCTYARGLARTRGCAPTCSAVGLISATMSLGRKREFVRG